MGKEKIWLEYGYRTFAMDGPKELRVDRLAKDIGKSKSSFYHFFADLEIFTEHLLRLHLKNAKIIGEKESKAQDEAGLIKVILDHKLDLLFNRQLRIHRDNPIFSKCFLETNEVSLPGLLPVWKSIIGLSENNYLANIVLMLSIENFYLQITDQSLNEIWLKEYFKNVREMVNQFKHSKSISLMDGSV